MPFNRPLDLGNVAKRWIAPLGPKIGVERLTPYTLRHAVATMLMRDGVPITVAAEMLGTSERMLHRHYLHAESDDLRRAATALARRL